VKSPHDLFFHFPEGVRAFSAIRRKKGVSGTGRPLKGEEVRITYTDLGKEAEEYLYPLTNLFQLNC